MHRKRIKLRAGAAVILLACSIAMLPESRAEESIPVEFSSPAYQLTGFPELSSEYVELVDIDNGQVLYEQNAQEKMYPASMTKMMTEILAIENLPDLDQKITISDEMWAGLIEANASVAGFWPGESPTVWDLLCGCALPSGADAVNALAITVSGSVSSFVDLMNQKAQEIGMDHTHFTNPTGLHDENHYSTAQDMAKLMAYCLQNESFRNLISLHSCTATTGLEMKSSLWAGLSSIDVPGLLGGKTGYTPQAGRCLASAAEQNGMKLVLVTGGSSGVGHLQDAVDMYFWTNDSIARTDLIHAGDPSGSIQILDAEESSIAFMSAQDLSMDLPCDAQIRITDTAEEQLNAPVEKGQNLGKAEILVNDTVVSEADLISDHDIHRSIPRYLIRKAKEHKAVVVPALILVCSAVLLLQQRKKALRRKRRRRTKHS